MDLIIYLVEFFYLEELWLNSNKIENEGIKYLYQENFTNLKDLNIVYNQISIEGVYYLSQSNLLNLQNWNISYNKIEVDKEEIKKVFQENFPYLKIEIQI
jgi:hypothetical protein